VLGYASSTSATLQLGPPSGVPGLRSPLAGRGRRGVFLDVAFDAVRGAAELDAVVMPGGVPAFVVSSRPSRWLDLDDVEAARWAPLTRAELVVGRPPSALWRPAGAPCTPSPAPVVTTCSAPTGRDRVRRMDPQWIGTISTLAGVLVAGGVAAVRDASAERRQVARDDSQRRHEIDEARFESRRDAYVGFAASCQTAINETDQYDFDHQGKLPGDHGHEGPIKRVIGALDLVLIIGPTEAADAALNASKHLHAWAFTAGSTRQQAVEAVDEFQALARRILKFDHS